MRLKTEEKNKIIITYQRLIFPNLYCLVEGIPAILLQYILDRTLRFGKFYETLPPSECRSANLWSFSLGLSHISERTLRRAKKHLIDMNFISLIGINQIETNAYGIIEMLMSLFDGINLSHSEDWNIFKEALSISKQNIKNKGGVVMLEKDDKLATIREAVKLGAAKSKAYRKKKAKEAEKKNPKVLSARDIRLMMISYCEEHETMYEEKAWTAKEAGIVKAWILQCRKDQEHPKDILEKVCKFWPVFYSGALKTTDGRDLLLFKHVNFMQFYTHRHVICDWLSHKTIDEDISSQYKFTEKVIDLRKRRKS